MSKTHVILGDGVAGMSAAQVIRAKRPDDRILLVSNDPHAHYYRAALTNYLQGELREEELWGIPADHWARLRLERVYGQVVSLDPAASRVVLRGNHTLPYDRLLICTGARARRLATVEQDEKRGVPGADLPGVTVMRTLGDTRKIVESLRTCRHAVVLGGGILGLEIADGLRRREVRVTLVHRGDWLLDRVVTRRAGELIQKRMARDGVSVHLNSGIERIEGNSAGVRHVVLRGGERVRCDLLLVSIGIIPNTEWLRDSGAELDRGFVVTDERMRVRGLDAAWAAGDVATVQDKRLPFQNPGGLWQPAKKQGQVAGLGMAHEGPFESATSYRPGVIYNATRAWDLDLGTLGDHVESEGRVLTWEDRVDGKPILKQVLLREGRVAGAMLLGDRREGHALRHLMNLRGAAGDVSSIADRLLAPDFDLPAWVASRSQGQDVPRWKETVALPAGPLPPSLAAAAAHTTQLQMAVATPMNTLVARSPAAAGITLRTTDQSHPFRQMQVRIGASEKCDLRVAASEARQEEIVLSAEGTVWVVSTDKARHPRAEWNGQPLLRPRAVQHGDTVRLGNWWAIVELDVEAPRADASDPQARPAAFLEGSQSYRLAEGVTAIGSGPDNDIQISDGGVELFHAQIHEVGSPPEYYLMDAGSVSGTRVNGQPVHAPVRLQHQDAVQLGAAALKFRLQAVKAVPVEEPPPARSAPNGREHDTVILKMIQGQDSGRTYRVALPCTIGRSTKADLTLSDGLLSRVHVRIERSGEGYRLADLGSLNGVHVDGERLASEATVPLREGAEIHIGRSRLRFDSGEIAPPSDFVLPEMPKPEDEPSHADAFQPAPGRRSGDSVSPSTGPRHGFRVDWAPLGDPLTRDLRKTVQEELDACIGCHECMRACPLPDSATVSIGALNAFAAGLGEPGNVARRFVSQCTQCQACVPVCPADIHRSRIVLWNKLKQTPSADHRITIQVGKEYVTSETTLGEFVRYLQGHCILGVLSDADRLELLGAARFRRLQAGELLLEEGMYADALWLVVDGQLAIGMATAATRFQQMTVLTTGQTIGETSLLSDQPSELTAFAKTPSFLLGLPKYAVKSLMQRHSKFRRELESLYVSKSMEAVLKKLPALEGCDDELLLALMETFGAERYLPGNEVLAANDAASTFAIVRRGFVKEVRQVDGYERVSDYLHEGDVFGARDSGRRGILLRFEAATLTEVLTLEIERLAELEPRWPGLTARLIPDARAARGPAPGSTAMFERAACEGLLQATQLMVIDTRMCVDCNNCVDACERRHGAARLDRSYSGLQVGPYQVPASCYHCDDPVCLLCAVDGIVREPSGEIRIVADQCIGCGACADRCPYGNIQMNPRETQRVGPLQRYLVQPVVRLFSSRQAEPELMDFERVAVKCDLCAGYGSGPACVRSCPTGAAQRVDPLAWFAGLDNPSVPAASPTPDSPR